MRLPLLTSPRTEAITDPPAASCYLLVIACFLTLKSSNFNKLILIFFSPRAPAREAQHAEGPSLALRSRTAMAIALDPTSSRSSIVPP
jgi:hypothetical protein